jgi:hypothetical protein
MRIKLSPLFLPSGLTSRLLIFVLAGYLAATSGCTSTIARHKKRVHEPQAISSPSEVVGDAQVVQAQEQHLENVEVTFSAPVKELLPDDTEGKQHQRFLLSLSNGTTVLVAHNTDLAPRVPVQENDVVTIHGQYIWNEKGGVVHYTHHTTSRKKDSGWIQFNSLQYQ